MLLTELLHELGNVGVGITGSWQIGTKKGVTLGDPRKSFPNPVGQQYPVDISHSNNPDLPDEVVRAIRRRFGIAET